MDGNSWWRQYDERPTQTILWSKGANKIIIMIGIILNIFMTNIITSNIIIKFTLKPHYYQSK